MNFGFLFKGMSSTVKLGKKCIKGIGYFLEDKFYIKVLLVFVFFVSVFSLVYMSLPTVSSGDDHFFHIRFAETIRQNGFFESFQNFKSIYFSKHAQGNEYFIYYNFLFYLVLIPFTYLKPLFLGIKLYAIFASSLAFSGLFWCLKKFEVRNPFVLTLSSVGILGSGLVYRFFLSRPYTLSPILLLFLLYLLHKKKYTWVFSLSFLYLFWHSSTFYFPIGIALCYFLFEKFYGLNGDYKNIFYSILGVVCGVGYSYLIAPGFLLFIYDTVFSIYKETIIGTVIDIPEGSELYKADAVSFIRDNFIVFTIFIFSVSVSLIKYIDSKKRFVFDTDKEKQDKILEGVLFFLSLCFFLGTVALSRRFQDYFVFFVMVFVYFVFSKLSKSIFFREDVYKRATKMGLVILTIYLVSSSLLFLYQNFANGPSPYNFKSVGGWLERNKKQGEVVFFPTWNWFPQLYYYAPRQNYIIGLEPRFTYEYDDKLYWKWTHISKDGFVCDKEDCPEMEELKKRAMKNEITKKDWFKVMGDKVSKTIETDFESTTIVSSKEFSAFNEILDHNDNFKREFLDRDSFYVYKIK